MKTVSSYLRSTNVFSAFLINSFAVLMAQPALAEEIRLGQPSYGGNGCPAGSASATLSPDQTQLSILFDKFQVEAGSRVGKTIDRKSCNIAIPVHVPQGLSVSILKMDYRGFNSLPTGAQSQFNVEYFFAGTRGLKYTRDFYGSQDDDFTISNELTAAAVVWSACGQDINLRTNASMYAKSNAYGEQASSTLDSVDIEAGVVYQIQWKTCGATNPFPVPTYTPTPVPTYTPIPNPPYNEQCFGNLCVNEQVVYIGNNQYYNTTPLEEATIVAVRSSNYYSPYSIRLSRTGQVINAVRDQLLSLNHRGQPCSVTGLCVNQEVIWSNAPGYNKRMNLRTFDDVGQTAIVQDLMDYKLYQVRLNYLRSNNAQASQCGLGFCVGDQVNWNYSRFYDKSAQVVSIDTYTQRVSIRARFNGAVYSVASYEISKSFF